MLARLNVIMGVSIPLPSNDHVALNKFETAMASSTYIISSSSGTLKKKDIKKIICIKLHKTMIMKLLKIFLIPISYSVCWWAMRMTASPGIPVLFLSLPNPIPLHLYFNVSLAAVIVFFSPLHRVRFCLHAFSP